MAINIVKVLPDQGLEFWNTSPHASIFTHPQVLSRLSRQVDWWLASKGEEPLCLWPVCLPDGFSVGLPWFSYYVGPLWSAAAAGMPAHRWLVRSTEVYEGFIAEFLSIYGTIHACLPPGLIDVRVFDWWNYHDQTKPRFRINPRYTACLDNLQGQSEVQIKAGFRRVRRWELTKNLGGDRFEQSDRCTVDELIHLYSEVMARQGADVDNWTENEIRTLVELVEEDYGEIVSFKEKGRDTVCAALLMLYAKGTANLVLSLTDSAFRQSGLPALLIYSSIMRAKEKGLTCFDFNGANSPNRGDDKHSYGAYPVLYFEINCPGSF